VIENMAENDPAGTAVIFNKYELLVDKNEG